MREFIGAAIFSVKPISRKLSWTEFTTRQAADRAAESHLRSKREGRHTRVAYRVNFYRKTTGEVHRVTAYDIKPDDTLGNVLRVFFRTRKPAIVDGDLFRMLSQREREIGDYSPPTQRDGVKVGRKLMDKCVRVDNDEVKGIVE